MNKFIVLLFLAFSFSYTSSQSSLNKTIPELVESNIENSSFRQDSISKLLRLIQETPHKDFRGLVVIEKNKIVIEQYYNTFWQISVHDIRSAGKSITAMLLGIAMKQGLVESLEQDVYSFFSKEKYPTLHEDLKKVKLKHLLDMASGLDADTDNTETSGHAVHWMAKDDWKPYILSVPQISPPGKRWVYADINALLIGAIIEEKSGLSLKDYAQQHLFDPLGIKQVYWYTNASNQTGAAGNLYISALDFAKLGLLISNKGKVGNEQIISQNYIEQLSNKTLDLTEVFGTPTSYGMFWYKSSKTLQGETIDYLYASGNGGNHLVVIPEKEIVIALTSSAYGPGYGQGRSYAIWDMLLESFK